MKGFRGKSSKEVQKIIDDDLDYRRSMTEDLDEEAIKVQDSRRQFLNKMMRPPHVWNFFEDENPTPHVLRADARPQDCYIDGRIEKVLEDIERLSINLRNHEDHVWNRLVQYTIDIFTAEFKKE